VRFIRAITVAAIVPLLGVAGATAASASTHHGRPAATPACGSNCFDLSSLALGTSEILNGYVAGDNGVVPSHGGQKLNLHYADDTRPNADFTGGIIGTVSQFCQSSANPQGVLSSVSVACTHYASSQVYEADWSPWGNESGYCAGLTTPGIAGNVVLKACGTSASTLWVVDAANAHFVSGHEYTPLINASDGVLSHPIVLTLNAGSRKPQNQLFAETENLLTGGYVANAQMWTLEPGPAV
jgi:hypothetical protein